MKSMILPGLVALIALGPASTVHAEGHSTTVFTCSVGKKTVSVTHADGRLTYHYGTGIHDEMSIVGIPVSGNVFQMTQRFAVMEYQLRFRNGDYSYIVYNSEGSGRVGAVARSGLVIMQGTKQISDRPCVRYTEFSVSLDPLEIPEDTEDYSAMLAEGADRSLPSKERGQCLARPVGGLADERLATAFRRLPKTRPAPGRCQTWRTSRPLFRSAFFERPAASATSPPAPSR